MRFLILVLSILVLPGFVFAAEKQGHQDAVGLILDSESINMPDKPMSYNDCILMNMQQIESDLAANEVKKACLREFPQDWFEGVVVTGTSVKTANNDGIKYRAGCVAKSPDGKYCADRVTITIALKDSYLVERQYPEQTCPKPEVIYGPTRGWYKLEDCEISNNKKVFRANIIGWTKPQRFMVSLKTNERVK